jgi:hypothetical protein
MSIESFQGQFTPTCDVCGKTLQAELSWQAAKNAMIKARWKYKVIDGEPTNICPKHKDTETRPADED